MWRLAFLIAMASVWTCGCSAQRDPLSVNVRYKCDAQGDCLSGFVCACGFCQPEGHTPLSPSGSCDTTNDAGAADAGGAVDAGSAADTGSDRGSPSPKNCKLLTWNGCPKGQACYWDSVKAETFCLSHGDTKENATCSPGTAECGVATDGTSLLCDSIDQLCYRLCSTTSAKCPAGMQCFPLEDAQGKWPQAIGICAPPG